MSPCVKCDQLEIHQDTIQNLHTYTTRRRKTQVWSNYAICIEWNLACACVCACACTYVWHVHLAWACFIFSVFSLWLGWMQKKKWIKVKNSHVQFPSPSLLAFAKGSEVSLSPDRSLARNTFTVPFLFWNFTFQVCCKVTESRQTELSFRPRTGWGGYGSNLDLTSQTVSYSSLKKSLRCKAACDVTSRLDSCFAKRKATFADLT